MKISTKGRYALRLVIDIAHFQESGPVSLRHCSERQDISIKYLEQLAGLLVRAHILKSTRGAHGGYTLAREATEITPGDVLRVCEGSTAPVACLEPDFGVCPRREECQTIAFWEGLDRVIEQYLDSVSVADLAKVKGPCAEFNLPELS